MELQELILQVAAENLVANWNSYMQRIQSTIDDSISTTRNNSSELLGYDKAGELMKTIREKLPEIISGYAETKLRTMARTGDEVTFGLKYGDILGPEMIAKIFTEILKQS